MLDKLESLVFGFDEFEKAKIDERFNQIPLILNELNIREIRDFEILENVIFKIKELLRVKSSNLNSIIRNPKKKLTKKQVLGIVEALDDLKYSFLKKAFSAIKKDEAVFEIKNDELETLNLNNFKIFENQEVKISIENGKVPYILLNFKNELDFVLVKKFSVLLFDTYNCHGTNILTQNNKVLIIPRFENDNFYALPQIQIDIDEIYSKFNLDSNKEIKNIEMINEESSKNFIEVDDSNIKRVESKEKQDDSLDALLNDMGNKNFKPKPNPKDDKSKIEVEKGDTVEVTIDKTKEIEVLKKEEVKKTNSKNIEKVHENIEISSKNYEIFRDSKIVVYLKENSKILGELIVENIFGKKLNELDDSIFTYMLMFSKVFGAILFETKEAHGTNIIYDFNDSKIRVMPRYQNDELTLNWNLNQATEDELNDIRDKLMKAMSSAMGQDKKDESKSDDSLKQENKKDENNEDKSQLKKKAEHILQSLKRIP